MLTSSPEGVSVHTLVVWRGFQHPKVLIRLHPCSPARFPTPEGVNPSPSHSSIPGWPTEMVQLLTEAVFQPKLSHLAVPCDEVGPKTCLATLPGCFAQLSGHPPPKRRPSLFRHLREDLPAHRSPKLLVSCGCVRACRRNGLPYTPRTSSLEDERPTLRPVWADRLARVPEGPRKDPPPLPGEQHFSRGGRGTINFTLNMPPFPVETGDCV